MNVKGYSMGIRGHDVADNFKDMCKLAKENQITNLQFAMAKTIPDINFDEFGFDEAFAKNIKDELDRHGLSVSVLGCYINPVHPDKETQKTMLKRFENFIRYAKVFDAKLIGTEPGYTGDLEYTLSEENYQVFLQNLSQLVKVAEEENVVIGIEPVWSCTINTAQKTKRLLDDINSDNIAVILDMSNITNIHNLKNHNEMIEEAFDILGEKIRAIHLKDFVYETDKRKFAPVGTGGMNVKRMFERISKMKNQPEIILDETPLGIYKDSIKRLESII
jgi:sugar phosphate isomerase/epimerase